MSSPRSIRREGGLRPRRGAAEFSEGGSGISLAHGAAGGRAGGPVAGDVGTPVVALPRRTRFPVGSLVAGEVPAAEGALAASEGEKGAGAPLRSGRRRAAGLSRWRSRIQRCGFRGGGRAFGSRRGVRRDPCGYRCATRGARRRLTATAAKGKVCSSSGRVPQSLRCRGDGREEGRRSAASVRAARGRRTQSVVVRNPMVWISGGGGGRALKASSTFNYDTGGSRSEPASTANAATLRVGSAPESGRYGVSMPSARERVRVGVDGFRWRSSETRPVRRSGVGEDGVAVEGLPRHGTGVTSGAGHSFGVRDERGALAVPVAVRRLSSSPAIPYPAPDRDSGGGVSSRRSRPFRRNRRRQRQPRMRTRPGASRRREGARPGPGGQVRSSRRWRRS